jgi:hypothetical protein
MTRRLNRRLNWNGIEGPKLTRFKEAYLGMARRARYRPGAPGDGCGNIVLSDEDLRDPVRLDEEAVAYAEKMDRRGRALSCGRYLGQADRAQAAGDGIGGGRAINAPSATASGVKNVCSIEQFQLSAN